MCYWLFNIIVRYDCANATKASPGTSSLASIQQADAQTAANETESKTQMLNSKSSSLKVVRQTYLSSAVAVCSPVAFFELEMSWKLIKCRSDLYLFCDDTFMWPSVNGNVLTNQIDIRSAKTNEMSRCKQALRHNETSCRYFRAMLFCVIQKR